MAGTTTIHSLRYPTGADVAEPHTDIKNLADDVEGVLSGYPNLSLFRTSVFDVSGLYENASFGSEKSLSAASMYLDKALSDASMAFFHVAPARFGTSALFNLAGAAMISALSTAQVPTLSLRKVSSFSSGVPTLAVASLSVELPSIAAADTVYEASGVQAVLTSGLYALTCSTPGSLHASADLKVWARLHVSAS